MSTQLWTIGILILGSLTASASQAQAMTTTCQGTYFADQGEKPGDEFEGGG
jgi:hypothetical protein